MDFKQKMTLYVICILGIADAFFWKKKLDGVYFGLMDVVNLWIRYGHFVFVQYYSKRTNGFS